MATLPQRILELLQGHSGLTDREIADRLFVPGTAQQPVNQACRMLETKRQLKRKPRGDGKIGNYLEEATISQITIDPTNVTAPNADSLSEDSTKLHLKNWLETHGWQVRFAWGRDRGSDIEAIKGGRRWIIEVKGSGSLDPMRVNYFLAILGETLQRMSDPNAKYSIALPDLQQFRNLWTRLPSLAKSRTTITALFVKTDGSVEEIDELKAGHVHGT